MIEFLHTSTLYLINATQPFLLSLCRYLNKMVSKHLPASQLPEDIAYLSTDFVVKPRCPVRVPSQYADAHVQLELYQQRAHR